MHRLSLAPVCAAMLAAVLALPQAAPADEAACSWPQFHGPKRDNVSPETGLLTRWPEGGPDLLWQAEGIGHGFTTVSIADGLIYTAGNLDEETVITAVGLDGKIRWQVANGAAWTGSHPGTRGVPTIQGERLYHESPLGEVVCLEARSGKRLWGRNILKDFGSKNITWALSESLLIDGPRLICCPGGPQTAVVALDKTSGETVWKSPSTGHLAGYASPSLAEHEGLRMILTMTAKAAIAVDADSGDLLWTFEHITPFDENVCKPVFHDGLVGFSTQTTGTVVLRLEVDGRKCSVREAWRSRDLDNHHGGVILLDGHLYGSGMRNGGRWACLDWKTGRTKYLARGVGKGSLTCADGHLYTLSERGLMGLVKAAPEGHEVQSAFRVPPGGPGRFWAHPVVCGGRLYLRHSDRLDCYDVSRK